MSQQVRGRVCSLPTLNCGPLSCRISVPFLSSNKRKCVKWYFVLCLERNKVVQNSRTHVIYLLLSQKGTYNPTSLLTLWPAVTCCDLCLQVSAVPNLAFNFVTHRDLARPLHGLKVWHATAYIHPQSCTLTFSDAYTELHRTLHV